MALLLLGSIAGSITTARDAQYWSRALRRAQQELVERYPSDLVVAWDGAQLSSSQAVWQLPYPSEFSALAQQYALPAQLAVYDATAAAGFHDALITLSTNSASIQADGQQLQTLPLGSVLSQDAVRVTKDSIAEYSTQFLDANLPPSVALFAILSVILFTLSLIVSGLFIAAVESLLIFLLLSALGRKWAYARVWQLALHALVFAEIVQQVAGVLFPNTAISWLSISFWVMMSYILLSVQHEVQLK